MSIKNQRILYKLWLGSRRKIHRFFTDVRFPLLYHIKKSNLRLHDFINLIAQKIPFLLTHFKAIGTVQHNQAILDTGFWVTDIDKIGVHTSSIQHQVRTEGAICS